MTVAGRLLAGRENTHRVPRPQRRRSSPARDRFAPARRRCRSAAHAVRRANPPGVRRRAIKPRRSATRVRRRQHCLVATAARRPARSPASAATASSSRGEAVRRRQHRRLRRLRRRLHAPDDVCGDGITECGEERRRRQRPSAATASPPICTAESCGNGDAASARRSATTAPAGSVTCTPAAVPRTAGARPPMRRAATTASRRLRRLLALCDDAATAPSTCDGVLRATCTERRRVLRQLPASMRHGCRREECDDGARTRAPATAARPPAARGCGNGIASTPGEQCDDGATTNECDGCAQRRARSGCRAPARSARPAPREHLRPVRRHDRLRSAARLRRRRVCSAGVCTPVTPPNCDDGNGCTHRHAATRPRGCVSTPVVCQDSTACDGTLSCNPATGQCVSGPAPDCDDGDALHRRLVHRDPPTAACSNQLRPGLDGATCRLSGPAEPHRRPRATSRSPPGRSCASRRRPSPGSCPPPPGTGKKAQKARKQIANGLKALTRTVAKAQRKLRPDTVSKLNTAITRTTVAVGNL